MNISEADSYMSATKIHAKLVQEGNEVSSVQTIRRILHAGGRHGCVARKLHFMSKSNIKKRMQFYTDYILKPLEF